MNWGQIVILVNLNNKMFTITLYSSIFFTNLVIFYLFPYFSSFACVFTNTFFMPIKVIKFMLNHS